MVYCRVEGAHMAHGLQGPITHFSVALGMSAPVGLVHRAFSSSSRGL